MTLPCQGQGTVRCQLLIPAIPLESVGPVYDLLNVCVYVFGYQPVSLL